MPQTYPARPQWYHPLTPACGHNLISLIAVATAIGLKAALKERDIPGTIKVIGSPAEEAGGGKVILLNEGVYDNLDACVMAHPGGGQPSPFDGHVGGRGPASLACCSFTAEFHGKGAHASSAPWLGINALDAAVQGYNAVAMLRQSLQPDERVHGIILGSERWTSNIIPDYSKVQFTARAPDVKMALELRDRTIACFTSAAKATRCRIEVDAPKTDAYAELRNNFPLAGAYADFMTEEFENKIDRNGMTTASTDFGNVTYKVPGIHPMFWIESDGVNHTKEFTVATRTKGAHARAVKVAKGLAVVGAKFLHDDDFSKEVKKAFREFKRGVEEHKGPERDMNIHPAAW